MILIGTGGYAYEDWRGVFYPPDLPAREMLAFYAREFPFTEVNSTYYRLPNRFMLYHMAEKTPEGFGFFLKAYRTMTHERPEETADFSAFRAALSPLLEGGRLLGVLAQFPTSFRATEANREYLRRFRSRLDGIPVAVEFRHREWITPETFQLPRKKRWPMWSWTSQVLRIWFLPSSGLRPLFPMCAFTDVITRSGGTTRNVLNATTISIAGRNWPNGSHACRNWRTGRRRFMSP